MLSIEETWKDLEAQAVVLAWAIPRVRKPDRTLDAARAYGLAVLEETIAHEALRDCGHAEGGAECFARLRARIEKLGE